MTIEELGQKTKDKYPAYSNLSNLELGNKVLEKYPEYQKQITEPKEQPKKSKLYESFQSIKSPETEYKGSQILGDIPTGVVKGAGSTIFQGARNLGTIVGGIGAKIFGGEQERKEQTATEQYLNLLEQAKTAPPAQRVQLVNQARQVLTDRDISREKFGMLEDVTDISKTDRGATIQEALTPQTTGEKIGYTGEKIGEFVLGAKATAPTGAKLATSATKLAQAKQLGTLGTKALEIGARSLPEAIATGAISLAQDKDRNIKDAFKNAAIDFGTNAALQGTTEALKFLLPKWGTKIQTAAIKPSKASIKQGFKIENLNKYDLGGSLPETMQKTSAKLNSLEAQLQKALTNADETVDLNKALGELGDRLESKGFKAFGKKKQYKNTVQSIYDELVDITGGKSKLSLTEANQLKRGVGAQGA